LRLVAPHRPLVPARGLRLVPLSQPSPNEGSGAPQGAPIVRACEARRVLGDQDARLAALHQRLQQAPLGLCPAPGRACVSRYHSGRQRAPRTGAVVPPGRVPEPPECPADEAEPAGAAQAGFGSTAAANPGTASLISARASRLLHQTSVTG
jgi:hypothetical protein